MLNILASILCGTANIPMKRLKGIEKLRCPGRFERKNAQYPHFIDYAHTGRIKQCSCPPSPEEGR
jgi:UDP-N-acetylmuramyl tripeptide synthase